MLSLSHSPVVSLNAGFHWRRQTAHWQIMLFVFFRQFRIWFSMLGLLSLPSVTYDTSSRLLLSPRQFEQWDWKHSCASCAALIVQQWQLLLFTYQVSSDVMTLFMVASQFNITPYWKAARRGQAVKSSKKASASPSARSHLIRSEVLGCSHNWTVVVCYRQAVWCDS